MCDDYIALMQGPAGIMRIEVMITVIVVATQSNSNSEHCYMNVMCD
jgi:hypothetical protein